MSKAPTCSIIKKTIQKFKTRHQGENQRQKPYYVPEADTEDIMNIQQAATAAEAAASNGNINPSSNTNMLQNSVNNSSLRVLELNPLKYIERLSTFDGRTEDLPIFLNNVDDIIPTLLTYNEQSQRMCINLLKSKFIGRARQAIEIHTHLTKWIDIKAMLLENFGGFKNSYQLYEDLRSSQFRGDVLKFYNYIQKTLSLLNQKCLQEGNHLDIPRNNETALQIFKEKLPVHMRTILYSLKPSSMESALHELSQAQFVNNSFDFKNNETANKNNNFKQNRYDNKNNNNKRSNWQPKPFHSQNNFSNQRQYNQNYQRPNENRQQYKQYPQKIEPMDIDPSSSQLRRFNPPKNNFIREEPYNEANFQYVASETLNKVYPISD